MADYRSDRYPRLLVSTCHVLACIVSQLSVGIPTTKYFIITSSRFLSSISYWHTSPDKIERLHLQISPPLRSPYTIQDSRGIYRTANLDTTFNAARGFSITASFFGLLSFFTLGFASCCPIPQSRMKCISIYFLIAFFFQAMTFIFKRSNVCKRGFFDPYFPDLEGTPEEIESVSCSLSRYSNMAIAATVLYWICAGMCARAIPPEPMPNVFNGEAQQRQPATQNESPAANEEEQA